MEKIKINVTTYRFDISEPTERTTYFQLREKLTNLYGNCFASHSWQDWEKRTEFISNAAGEQHVETEYLFPEQFNTAPNDKHKGQRLHLWAEEIFPNRDIKDGYYVECCPELLLAINSRLSCGYTGKQFTDPNLNGTFNLSALGGEYLTEKDLPLLRIMPITYNEDRPALTDDERAYLLPLFMDAQINGVTERDKERIAALRQKLNEEKEKTISNAHTEYNGFTWLLDNGVKTDNVIFYKHTERFCLGWRNPLSAELAKEFAGKLLEFPFPIDIKTS